MRRRVVTLALAFALAAAACGGGGTEAAKPSVTIGLIGALTGDNAQLVVHSRNAVQMAIEKANAAGDLPVTLVLAAEDSTGDKDKAVPLAQKLAGDANVVAVIGPHFSGESFAANPILQQAGIPQVTPAATNPGIAKSGFKRWWRAVGNDNSQGGPAPDVFLTYLKAKKVFIGHDKTAYGEGLATIVRDGLKAKDPAAVVGFEAVDPGKKDYSALASKIVSSKADVLFWGAYSPEGALVLKQSREKGFKGTYVGADGSKDDTFLKGAGTDAEGALHLCPCADVTVSADPAVKKFVADYKARFNADPGIYAGEGWDAAQLIWVGIRSSADDTSPLSLRAAIAKSIGATSGFKGLTKTYAFQPDGELVQSAVVIYLYKVVGGKFTLLGPVADLIKM